MQPVLTPPGTQQGLILRATPPSGGPSSMQPCRHAAPSAVPPTWLASLIALALLCFDLLIGGYVKHTPQGSRWKRGGRGGKGVCSGVRPVWISWLRYSLGPDFTERDGLSASCSGHGTLAPLRPSPHIRPGEWGSHGMLRDGNTQHRDHDWSIRICRDSWPTLACCRQTVPHI